MQRAVVNGDYRAKTADLVERGKALDRRTKRRQAQRAASPRRSGTSPAKVPPPVLTAKAERLNAAIIASGKPPVR